jgi:two-component sensor histidine kinase
MSKKTAIPEAVFSSNKRANEILKAIMAFAQLDFSKKIPLSEKNDYLDGISEGVNMLGDELETSTISLKEKEQLLKEIHHRVKNNLQIISSLLSLQSENVLDEKFLLLIRDSKNRINSMALVHEMLYASKSLEKISVSEYIGRLSNSLTRSMASPGSLIKIDHDIPADILFEIDRIIPLGLILNEIISNSFKYGFPHTKNGKIMIRLESRDSAYSLYAGDNGIGLPENFNIYASTSLGMQLIRMLCEQIEGSLSIKRERGLHFYMTFPTASTSHH